MAALVRDAEPCDMAAVQAIYAHYVRHSLVTFEIEPPAIEEMVARLADVRRQSLPYLVAEIGGSVAGYCYATGYRARAAYRHTIESSVYIEQDQIGKGLGRLLMQALIARCEAGPWRQLIAVVGDSANEASLALHRSLGFRYAGTLEAVGFKFGRWVDTVFLQLPLGPGATRLPMDAPRS